MWNVTDWQKVVFSDESRFVLGTDDNRVRVWRCPGDVLLTAVPEHITHPAFVTFTNNAIFLDSPSLKFSVTLTTLHVFVLN
ncbi:hypothetical protein TNCV_3329131 [Trichonephila clavipes]|nr:hypothetical protein TNCV_3329131 [Trichonephila clavipes]